MKIRTATSRPASLDTALYAISLLKDNGRLQDCCRLEAELHRLHQAPIVPFKSDQKRLESVWKEHFDLQRQLLDILVDQKRESRLSEKIRARVAVMFRAGRMTTDVLEGSLNLLWNEVIKELREAIPPTKVIGYDKAV